MVLYIMIAAVPYRFALREILYRGPNVSRHSATVCGVFFGTKTRKLHRHPRLSAFSLPDHTTMTAQGMYSVRQSRQR